MTLRIKVDFDHLAGLLLDDDAGEWLSQQGYQLKEGKTWEAVNKTVEKACKEAPRYELTPRDMVIKRLANVISARMAMTPSVILDEAISLKEAIRVVTKDSKAHRSLARRIVLLAEYAPSDTDDKTLQKARLALDIAATRENISLPEATNNRAA